MREETVETLQRLTDVPDNRVEKIMSQFRAEGASDVVRVRAANGTWTVEAVFAENEGRFF